MPECNPDPVDVHVGNRLRAARLLSVISQADAGKAVELTFQQIQKYENGKNRVAASRLVKFAVLYGRPVQWFFEGAPGYTTAESAEANDLTGMFFSLPYAQEVAANYISLKHNQTRDVVRQVVAALVGHD